MATVLEIGRGDILEEPELAAAARLYERHGRHVFTYCLRRLRSREEAEDALQTTFFYACRGLRRGVVPAQEIAWLLKIAKNVCLSHWDESRRRNGHELAHDPSALESLESTAPSGRDELRAIQHALACLTDLQQQAILLREWRGLSYREIAAELKLSTAAVEALIFRARKALADRLESQEAVPPPRARPARGFGLGPLLGGMKSALGLGSAAKIAATGATLTATLVATGSTPASPSPSSEKPAVVAGEHAPIRSAWPLEPTRARSRPVGTGTRAARTDGGPSGTGARTHQEPKGGATGQLDETDAGGGPPAGAGGSPTSAGWQGDLLESAAGELMTGASSTTNAVLGAVTQTTTAGVETVTQTTSAILEPTLGEEGTITVGGEQEIVVGGKQGIAVGGSTILPPIGAAPQPESTATAVVSSSSAPFGGALSGPS